MTPKHNSNCGAGNKDLLKRNNKVLPLSKKVKILNLTKEKHLYVEVAKIYIKIESFVHEIMKKKNNFMLAFAVVLILLVLLSNCQSYSLSV